METQHAHMHAPPSSHLLYRVGQGSRSPWLSCFFVQIDAAGPRRKTWTRWPGEKLAMVTSVSVQPCQRCKTRVRA